MKVSVAYAKDHLTRLLKAVGKGDAVTIFRHGKPIAKLVPPQAAFRPGPQFGTGRGSVEILDPHWDKAIETQEELDTFLKGRLER